MNNYILYFIVGQTPTPEEYKDAEQYMGKGPMFEFVSLSDVDLNAPLRGNVGVFGSVPDVYKPVAVPVVSKRKE